MLYKFGRTDTASSWFGIRRGTTVFSSILESLKIRTLQELNCDGALNAPEKPQEQVDHVLASTVNVGRLSQRN
jgi:hypothetical protein